MGHETSHHKKLNLTVHSLFADKNEYWISTPNVPNLFHFNSASQTETARGTVDNATQHEDLEFQNILSLITRGVFRVQNLESHLKV